MSTICWWTWAQRPGQGQRLWLRQSQRLPQNTQDQPCACISALRWREPAPGKTALDAIEAVLPAGTLSGAPKFRAMQIIDELEGSKRGIYGGAIGYIDLTGNMDTCISIRIAYKKNGTVYIRSGAGIVADSVPEKEHTECINKAMAVVQAVRESAGDAQ